MHEKIYYLCMMHNVFSPHTFYYSILIHTDILEIFVSSEHGTTNKGTSSGRKVVKAGATHTRFSSGRVGLRCQFCKNIPANSRANLSTIYPETLSGIYRAVSVRFQKKHLPSCKHIPKTIRDQLDILSMEKAGRGSKSHWVSSAMRKGLRNSDDEKGIIFCPEIQS